MKFAAVKYGKLNSAMRLFLIIICTCACNVLQAQVLSFETDVIETENYDGIYKKTIETHDGGFLFLTVYTVTKIDRKGQLLWKYEFKNGRNPKPQYPFYPGVGNVHDDTGGIYLHGEVFASPYYLRLNHDGELVFDTVYLESWKDTIAPFNENRHVLKDGDYFLTTGITYENLRFDSINNRWEWDKSCYAFHKLDKFGNRITNYYDCFSDTSQIGGSIVKLNGLEKEYLIFMVISNSQFGNSYNYCVLHVDSIGRILHMNYMPRNSSIIRFEKLYGPDEGEGACMVTYDYHYYLNRKGELVKQVPNNEVVKYGIKQKQQLVYPREITDTFTFFDSSLYIVWEKRFERAKSIITDERGIKYVLQFVNEIGYNKSYKGLLYIYTNTDYSIPDFRFGYILIHINKEGWPIGYDPDNLPPDKDTLIPEPVSKEGIWFSQSGDLRFPPSLSGWQFRVSDMTGKTLSRGIVPKSGEIPVIPLSVGVYVVQCRNVLTGQEDNRKVFKGN
jgi:hypothetical protein